MVTPSHTASARNEKYRKQTHKWPCSLLPWLESKLPKGYLLPPAPCHKFSDVAREMWHWLSPNLQLIANPNACLNFEMLYTCNISVLVCDHHITSYNYIGWREISRIERLMILVEHGGTLPNARNGGGRQTQKRQAWCSNAWLLVWYTEAASIYHFSLTNSRRTFGFLAANAARAGSLDLDCLVADS